MTGGPSPGAAGGGAPEPGPVGPAVALGYAVVGFAALAICGLGIASLVTDQDVIAVRGLGPIPGVVGMILATAGFAGAVWPFLRAARPTYSGAFASAAAALFGYLVGVSLGGLVSGADPAATVAAAGGVATSWFAVVLALSGLVAGWAAVALVRTRARRPRWPWEDDDEE